MDIPLSYYVDFWVIALFVGVLLILALEVGFRIGISKHDDKETQVSESSKIVLSSLLLVLGLILAFTFNASVHRYEARKAAAIEEANAIGTLFFFADYIQEPNRSELINTVYEYAKSRTSTDVTFNSIEEVEKFIANSIALQNQIIYQTSEAVKNGMAPGLETWLIRATSSMINAHTKRAGILNDTLPLSVILLQLLIATVALGFAGYMSGISGKISRWQIYALTFCLFCVIMTAQDFDRSVDGFIYTNQNAIDNIVDRISKQI